jgi:hypothetical protein
MTPTVGRIVHYTLTEGDATRINRRRTTGDSIAKRMKGIVGAGFWSVGAQAHIGVEAKAGDLLPGIVVFVDPVTSVADLQVFLRGNDVLYVAGCIGPCLEGNEPGLWTWPPRA